MHAIVPLPMDLAKYLAINCKNQRERDQYIIDHAQYFKLVYKTQKSNEISGKFNDLEAARVAADYVIRLMPLVGRKNMKPLSLKAYLEDTKGNVFDAVVEEVAFPTREEYINGR